MTSIDPLARLKAFVGDYTTQRAAAKALGVSAPFLTMVLKGDRQIPGKILRRLGLQREIVVSYRRNS